jgi:hypothetical protein
MAAERRAFTSSGTGSDRKLEALPKKECGIDVPQSRDSSAANSALVEADTGLAKIPKFPVSIRIDARIVRYR